MSAFETAIMQAIVDRFFEPVVVGTDYSTGNPIMGQSPVGQVAQAIYDAKRGEIIEVLKDRLSVDVVADALAKRITEDVVTRMTSKSMWSSYDHDQQRMRTLVNERIADELARRALAKMDADGE